MSYELTGILLHKFKTIQRTATFRVREFVVERSEEIGGKVVTNPIKFQMTQDRVDILDKFNPGDRIQVSFNIRGSKWEKDGQVSYFNNLDAWKIVNASDDKGAPESPKTTPGKASDDLFSDAPDEDDDSDLPF
ncbi:MAG: DUF3127 domain-containing protein [Chitinophagaceae bacterium]|nr:DUF3127 domain-containing protein [Chitinophagaceae bacterium]